MTEPAIGALPRADAALFNPAFVGLLLSIAAREHQSVSDAPMPAPLIFLVPGIALHADTRQALPANIARRMSGWIIANPLIQVSYPERARAMMPVVRQGLRYAARSGAITIEAGGIRSQVSRSVWERLATDDARSCARAAAFVGRWFARSGDSAAIYALLGLRP